MKISNKGVNFIINEEGEVLTAYKCPGNVWTVGVGHTGKEIKEGMNITKEQSRELLKTDLIRFENAVNNYVEVPLRQWEFDALVSFSFNVGVGAFKDSTLLKKVNNSAALSEIETEFRRWNKSGGKILDILKIRREREIKLYKGEWGKWE